MEMSSQEISFASSPPSILDGYSVRRRKSRFTFKHLTQLSLSSTACPLRVIALIDLDAFYAQCESIRLGLPEDQPLAVQQWGGLIAINYPSREYGVTRFMNMAEAKRRCPDLLFQHVATWKEGDDKWAYREQSAANMATQKVSLDPYRAESRKILAAIRDCLPAAFAQHIEKASIDEVFLDLSAQVHSILLERYPDELARPPPYDDPTEYLPSPPSTVLDWQTDSLIDLDVGQTEVDDPDWDDLAMLIGSEIIRDIRNTIRAKLKYTMSAGIAKNKMLAKLGAGHKKPNNQTVVRNRAVQQFLSDFKFTKIRNLGGKLGQQVVSAFGTELVSELLKIPLDQMKSKLDDDAGSWVYKAIRGEENSEVNLRMQIKSMLSAKSFQPSINTEESALRWLRIFVADIYSRLVTEGILENKRRPKTINLHHRQGGVTRSRQLGIPSGKKIDEALLLDLSRTLLSQIIIDGRAWPCANLSLSVGGFEDGPSGNMGIGNFLLRGEEARAMSSTSRPGTHTPEDTEHRSKKQKLDYDVKPFFRLQRDSSRDEPGDESEWEQLPYDDDIPIPEENTNDQLPPPAIRTTPPNQTNYSNSYICPKCHASIHIENQAEHEDWHFAKTLQAAERETTLQQQQTQPQQKSVPKGTIPAKKSKSTHPGGKHPASKTALTTEKGQQRLAFGKPP